TMLVLATSLPLFPMLGETRSMIEAAHPDHKEFNCYPDNNQPYGFEELSSVKMDARLADFLYSESVVEKGVYRIGVEYLGCDDNAKSISWSAAVRDEMVQQAQTWLAENFGDPTSIKESKFGRSIEWKQGGFEISLFFRDNGLVSLIENI